METKKIILSGVATIAMAGALYGACTGDLNLGGNYINELKTKGNDSPTNTEEYRAANIKYVRDYVSAYVDANATLPSGLIKDSEDNIYTTKLFGSNMWMTENLKIGAHTTPNGNSLKVCTEAEWTANSSFCYATSAADGSAANAGIQQTGNYGYLYQWNAAMDGNTTEGARGICPSGWHIPTDKELQNLEGVVSDNGNVKVDPEKTGWRFGNDNGDTDTGTNDVLSWWGDTNASKQVGTQMKLVSKFNGVMAGFRSNIGAQGNQGTTTHFWSSSESESDEGKAWRRYLGSSFAGVYRNEFDKKFGFSVRCVKPGS